jgi:hypothetical protein
MYILVRFYLRIFLKKHNSQINLAEYGMKLESIIQSAVEKGDISIVAKNQMFKSKSQLPNIERGFTLFLARTYRQLRLLISITT